MQDFLSFLNTSYTAFQAVENARKMLLDEGFEELFENEEWDFSKSENDRFFVVRGGSAIIAFTVGNGCFFKIVASHTDSPCLKLKESPVIATEKFSKLNVEPYGGGLWYTFFDRPLKVAGRVIRESGNVLRSENYVSEYTLTIPSLAVHMQREVNDKFAPNPQVDLLPLLGMDDKDFLKSLGSPLAFDLFLSSAQTPFLSGMKEEFINSPRIDNLSSMYASLVSLIKAGCGLGVTVAACLDSEEVGSCTRSGAGGDFLRVTLEKIAKYYYKEDLYRAASRSFMISLDNAHSVHPNHPEKCDLTSRAVMGGGIVIKGHAGGAYTTDALSSSFVKKLFKKHQIPYQCFFNRSDMRSGSTLGAISLGQISIPSADLGLAQLAMHSAVECVAAKDFETLLKGLEAFYQCNFLLKGDSVEIH